MSNVRRQAERRQQPFRQIPFQINQKQKIENRIGEIEKAIPQMEEELAKITWQMSQPEVISNHEQLKKVSRKFAETETIIQKLYKEWEELS